MDLKSDEGLPLNTCEEFSQIQTRKPESGSVTKWAEALVLPTVDKHKGRGDEHLG